MPPVFIGQASWSIPREHAAHFPVDGSHLERYAARLNAAEINTSFYRPHQPKTYARWAASVPAGFRFAVKAPREITHFRRLTDADEPLAAFLYEAGHLGDRLGPLLFQLPPKLPYDPAVAPRFFAALRARHAGPVVLEPRHRSWFTAEVEALLVEMRIARVAADPSPVSAGTVPAGYAGLVYYRWHGSPRRYYSTYSPEAIAHFAALVREASVRAETWCIFDNTAAFAATGNALELAERLDITRPGGR